MNDWYKITDPKRVRRREEVKAQLAQGRLEGLVQLEKDAQVELPVYLEYGNVHLGRMAVVGANCTFLDSERVDIGDYAVIGPNCTFITSRRPMDAQSRRRQLEQALPIQVEEDVWIGAGSTILPGLTIGKGAVVEAGSVVVRDVPENTVAAGNPAEIRRRLVQNMTMEERMLPEGWQPDLLLALRLLKQGQDGLEFEAEVSGEVDQGDEAQGQELMGKIAPACRQMEQIIRKSLEKWNAIPFSLLSTSNPDDPSNVTLSLLFYREEDYSLKAAVFYGEDVTNGYPDMEERLDQDILPLAQEVLGILEEYVSLPVQLS